MAGSYCNRHRRDANDQSSIRRAGDGSKKLDEKQPHEHTKHDCLQRFFRLPLDQLGYLRFILESYEGLAVMSSMPGRGEVLWTIPASRADEAANLAAALAREFPLIPLPPPPDWHE